MAIQDIFLPFLRVAALLKYHLFNVEFPSQMVGNLYAYEKIILLALKL